MEFQIQAKVVPKKAPTNVKTYVILDWNRYIYNF